MLTTAPAAALDFAAQPDETLVLLAQRARREAFGELMRRHNQRLYRLARSILRNDAEAEDVVQETYCRAFAALDGFRGAASFATWLSRIAINEALGRRRRRPVTVALDAVEAGQAQPGGQIVPFPSAAAEADPERMAAQGEIRRLLEQAIDDLPDGFRTVFMMRVVEGLSTEETAGLLALRPETVKTRLHRARRLLQAALDDRIGNVLSATFPFLGARCERITASVLSRLGLS